MMMSNDNFESEWLNMKSQIQKRWGKLTEEEVEQIDGNREQLINKLQVKYGYPRNKAQSEVEMFEKTYSNM